MKEKIKYVRYLTTVTFSLSYVDNMRSVTQVKWCKYLKARLNDSTLVDFAPLLYSTVGGWH